MAAIKVIQYSIHMDIHTLCNFVHTGYVVCMYIYIYIKYILVHYVGPIGNEWKWRMLGVHVEG